MGAVSKRDPVSCSRDHCQHHDRAHGDGRRSQDGRKAPERQQSGADANGDVHSYSLHGEKAARRQATMELLFFASIGASSGRQLCQN